MMTDVSEIKNRVDLLELVSRDTTVKRVASTGGGEWAGACPFCESSFDDLERAALAALGACQRASDSGDSVEAERRADEFDRLSAALWSKVIQLPKYNPPFSGHKTSDRYIILVSITLLASKTARR